MSLPFGTTREPNAICGRCNRRFPYSQLSDDPNVPGLRVCERDKDVLDPYRLPARQTENINLQYPRPDTDLAINGEESDG